MGKPIIATGNGAFSSYRSKDNTYMSDIVEKIIDTTVFPNGYLSEYFKGGMWNSPDRDIKDWMSKYDKSENFLFYCGKSAGVWDMSKPILKDYVCNCLYTKRVAVFIDGTYPFRIKPLHIKGFQKVINFYQPNGFLHGDEIIVENSDCKVEQYKLTDKINGEKIDHFNIIFAPQIEQKIREALSEVLS